MKKLFFLSLILPLIVFLGCKKDDKTTKVINPDARILFHDGLEREYILHIPEAYDGTTEVPLLFNFHGFGGIASEYMNEADMRGLAESESFILVYPQGTLLNGLTHWNAALNTPDNKSDTDDLGFIEALINKLKTEFSIDTKRIYACGYSNGAMFSYALACYKSDLIAAIGSVSGTMLDTDCTTSHPMPLINIHGTSDDVLPYNGNAEYNSVESILDFWNNFNNTNTTPVFNSVEVNGQTIEHYNYEDGDSNVSLEHFKILGGKHVWFDINYQGSNTEELIWRFVSKYNIDGLE